MARHLIPQKLQPGWQHRAHESLSTERWGSETVDSLCQPFAFQPLTSTGSTLTLEDDLVVNGLLDASILLSQWMPINGDFVHEEPFVDRSIMMHAHPFLNGFVELYVR